MNDHATTAKHVLDSAAAATAFATWFGLLPNIAALLSIIWLSIQIGGWAVRKWKEWR